VNERIRELWDKAAYSVAYHPSGRNNSWETQVNFIDKFAQLIVGECLEICKQREQANLYGVKEALATIREHFEVEE
jgi:hypothetical protein